MSKWPLYYPTRRSRQPDSCATSAGSRTTTRSRDPVLFYVNSLLTRRDTLPCNMNNTGRYGVLTQEPTV